MILNKKGEKTMLEKAKNLGKELVIGGLKLGVELFIANKVSKLIQGVLDRVSGKACDKDGCC